MNTIIFDMDDTLVVEEESARAAFLRTCEFAQDRCGVDPQELHAAVRQSCRALWHASPARAYCLQVGISSWEGLWAEFLGPDESLAVLRNWCGAYRTSSWHEALRTCGHDRPELASELADTFIRERRKLHVVYDDVMPALEHLRASCRLGLLTNGALDLQRRKLEGSGLAHFFDEVVISGEVGFGKPDERIFNLILALLCTAAESAVMVGNSLSSDIQPAKAVGMKTVWLNRGGNARDESIIPDAEVASLTRLEEFLERGAALGADSAALHSRR